MFAKFNPLLRLCYELCAVVLILASGNSNSVMRLISALQLSDLSETKILDNDLESTPRQFGTLIPLSDLPTLILPPDQQLTTQSKYARSQDNAYSSVEHSPDIVLPYEEYAADSNNDFSRSYVIDNKRFVEALSTRCFSSTILEDPASVEPQFIIIKSKSEIRINATAPLELVRAAGFEPEKLTIILIHGYTQSYPATPWLRKVRALFEIHSLVPRYNLIIMDWGTVSHGQYGQVAARVSGMGSFLANFLLKLFDLGADRASIHIIGHSLGAHIAGFAGKRLRPRIGRITALDPAGPCFGKIMSNSRFDRLAPDDAYEVDVFHYDNDFLGLAGQIGQFDVHVNGGSSQPGCTDNVSTMFQAFITMMSRRNRILSESHTRSTEVAMSDLSPTACQEIAFECRDWPSFVSGMCGRCDDNNDQCFDMGFPFQYANVGPQPLRSSFPGKRYYIATTDKEPFCVHHYQIVVKFEPSPELTNHIKKHKWRLHLDLINDRNERSNVTVTNQMAPNAFSYLFLTEVPPARIRAALLQVRSSDSSVVQLQKQVNQMMMSTDQWSENQFYGPRPAKLSNSQQRQKSTSTSFRVNRIEVNFMSNFDPNIRRMLSSVLCPTSNNWIVDEDRRRLVEQQSMKDDKKKLLSSQDDWIGFDECLAY